MEKRRLDIVVSENNKSIRLTITPDRLTIKFPEKFKGDKDFYINFSQKLENEMLDVKQSWRGAFHKKGIQMRTNNKKQSKTFFYEDNN